MTAMVAREIVIWKNSKCKNKYFISIIPSPRNIDEEIAEKVTELEINKASKTVCLLSYNVQIPGFAGIQYINEQNQLGLNPELLTVQILKRSKD